MSKFLSALLNEPPADTEALVLALEKLSGHTGIDVKLALEIKKVMDGRVKKLGLDPADTTPKELYRGLLAKYSDDNARFTRLLGGRSGHSHSQLVPRVVNVLNKLDIPKNCWVLKRSEARKVLKAVPPKKLIKFLHYRTVDSLLKRENTDELIAAAIVLESPTWAKNFNNCLSKLSPADFERRQAQLVYLVESRWQKLPTRGAMVGYVPVSGAVIVWPASPSESNALALAVLILQALWSLRVVSSWLEFNQVKPDFGKRVADTTSHDLVTGVKIAGHDIAWQSFAYHFGQAKKASLPLQLDSQLNFADIEYLPIAAQLSTIDSRMHWWLGLDYVGSLSKKVVSFNLTDVALNYANRVPHERAGAQWLSLGLKDELISRYMSSRWVEDYLLESLEENNF